MNRSDAATQVLVDRGAELADQLERAIRWVVHLEGQLAAIEAALAGPEQAVVKVAAAQQVLIDARGL